MPIPVPVPTGSSDGGDGDGGGGDGGGGDGGGDAYSTRTLSEVTTSDGDTLRAVAIDDVRLAAPVLLPLPPPWSCSRTAAVAFCCWAASSVAGRLSCTALLKATYVVLLACTLRPVAAREVASFAAVAFDVSLLNVPAALCLITRTEPTTRSPLAWSRRPTIIMSSHKALQQSSAAEATAALHEGAPSQVASATAFKIVAPSEAVTVALIEMAKSAV